MWVARVLERSDEYMRRRTCRRCKAANSKKLLRNRFKNRWQTPRYWLRNCLQYAGETPMVSTSINRLDLDTALFAIVAHRVFAFCSFANDGVGGPLLDAGQRRSQVFRQVPPDGRKVDEVSN